MQKQNLSAVKVFVATTILLITGCKSGDNNERTWSVYKADANSSSESPLDQVNVSNVSQLQPAWIFTTNDLPVALVSVSPHSNLNIKFPCVGKAPAHFLVN